MAMSQKLQDLQMFKRHIRNSRKKYLPSVYDENTNISEYGSSIVVLDDELINKLKAGELLIQVSEYNLVIGYKSNES